MPERQSPPGGTTAEQDAEAPAGDPGRPGGRDEPTRPVARGDAATVGLSRAVTPTPTGDRSARPAGDRPPLHDADSAEVTRPAESPIVVRRTTPDAEATQVIRA